MHPPDGQRPCTYAPTYAPSHPPTFVTERFPDAILVAQILRKIRGSDLHDIDDGGTASAQLAEARVWRADELAARKDSTPRKQVCLLFSLNGGGQAVATADGLCGGCKRSDTADGTSRRVDLEHRSPNPSYDFESKGHGMVTEVQFVLWTVTCEHDWLHYC